MSDADDDAGPVLDDDAEAVATSAATDRDAFLDVLPHFYRGEVAQASAAQDRIDRTTDWVIALIAALLSLVFSSPSMPA